MLNKVVEVQLYKPRKRPQMPRRAHFKPKTRKGTKPRKAKPYGLKKADNIFSEKIRTRDGKCQFPGCKVNEFGKLQCSHYIGRATKSTRFDPDNCIALCWLHHFKDKMLGYEYQKQRIEKHGWDGQYTIFMRNLLGTERFNALIERSTLRISQKKAIEAFLTTLL